jgi:hypothetical protein
MSHSKHSKLCEVSKSPFMSINYKRSSECWNEGNILKEKDKGKSELKLQVIINTFLPKMGVTFKLAKKCQFLLIKTRTSLAIRRA